MLTAHYRDSYYGDDYDYLRFEVCPHPEDSGAVGRTPPPDTEHAGSTSSAKELRVYPIPAYSELHISGLEQKEQYSLQLTDMQGRPVLPAGIVMRHGVITMQVRSLAAGIYLLHLQTPQRTLRQIVTVTR